MQFVARNSRGALLVALIVGLTGAILCVAFRDWRPIAAGLVVAASVLVLTRLVVWPGARRLLVSDAQIVLSTTATEIACASADIKSCRIEWTSGTALFDIRRTRFDAWSLACIDRDGHNLLQIDDAQDFGARRLRILASMLHVPCQVPSDWDAAQGRWLSICAVY